MTLIWTNPEEFEDFGVRNRSIPAGSEPGSVWVKPIYPLDCG